jgi:hypothetical protein
MAAKSALSWAQAAPRARSNTARLKTAILLLIMLLDLLV